MSALRILDDLSMHPSGATTAESDQAEPLAPLSQVVVAGLFEDWWAARTVDDGMGPRRLGSEMLSRALTCPGRRISNCVSPGLWFPFYGAGSTLSIRRALVTAAADGTGGSGSVCLTCRVCRRNKGHVGCCW